MLRTREGRCCVGAMGGRGGSRWQQFSLKFCLGLLGSTIHNTFGQTARTRDQQGLPLLLLLPVKFCAAFFVLLVFPPAAHNGPNARDYNPKSFLRYSSVKACTE